MTAFRFRCSHCQSKLSAELHLRKEACGCPKCGKKIIPENCSPLDVRFVCTACQAPLLVDQKAAGRQIACPKCSERLMVPDPSQPARPLFDPASAALSAEEIEFLTAP